MTDITEVLAIMIPIIAIVGFFVMIVYLRRYENSERMSMIEKGVDPALFAKKQRDSSGPLRASLLFIGVGVGLLMGLLVEEMFNIEPPLPYFSMLFIFGGLGLGAAYIIEEKKSRKEKE